MSLMEQFIAARGGPIRHGDRELLWTYVLPVSTGDLVRVRFRDYVRDPVQGLAIDCADCEVVIAEQAGTKFQVWTDSAPETFDIHVRRAKSGARLKFLNVWGDASHSPMMYRRMKRRYWWRDKAPPKSCFDAVMEWERYSSMIWSSRSLGSRGSPSPVVPRRARGGFASCH